MLKLQQGGYIQWRRSAWRAYTKASERSLAEAKPVRLSQKVVGMVAGKSHASMHWLIY